MEYGRSHYAGSAPPLQPYSKQSFFKTQREEDEDTGFLFDQSISSFGEFDEIGDSMKKTLNNSSSFGLTPGGLAFESRSFSADVMKSPQQHMSTSPPKPHVSNWGRSLPSVLVENNNYHEAANFLLECKGGDETATMDFLRGVFLALTTPHEESISPESHDWDSAIRGGPPYLKKEDQAAAQTFLVMHQRSSLLLQAQKMGVTPRAPPVSPINFFGDEIDQRMSTLVVLVPGRAHIVGHLIGKGGAEVGRIEREMSVTIKIESVSKMNVQLMERSVCIIGSVAAVSVAQQYVSHKVHEKLLSEGVQAEVLKMIVPNEIVRHLIGKSGANINRLQNESGARIQVEPESTMNPGSVGRTIVLQGAEKCRTFAQYLIIRQIAEDRNVHSEWAGRTPQNATNNLGNGSGSPVLGANMSTSSPTASPSTLNPNASTFSTPGDVHYNNNNAFMSSIAQLAATSNQGLPSSPFSPGTTNNGSDEERISLMIPEQLIPTLIGRNGMTIAEIQNMSGARINIPKSLGNGDGRRITISGTSHAVAVAQQILHKKMQPYRGGIE